jgi:hypothetical protein
MQLSSRLPISVRHAQRVISLSGSVFQERSIEIHRVQSRDDRMV